MLVVIFGTEAFVVRKYPVHPPTQHTHTHTHTHVHIGLKRDVDNEEQGPNRDTADFRIKKAQVLISNGFNRYPLLKVGKYE